MTFSTSGYVRTRKLLMTDYVRCNFTVGTFTPVCVCKESHTFVEPQSSTIVCYYLPTTTTTCKSTENSRMDDPLRRCENDTGICDAPSGAPGPKRGPQFFEKQKNTPIPARPVNPENSLCEKDVVKPG